MKKTILWLLVLVSLAALILRFSDKLAETFFGIKQTSGISILSVPSEAVVYLDDKEVGKTPFEDKGLEAKGYTVKIVKEGVSWQGRVKLNAGTVTVVNRDLAADIASSAGEILTLNKGKGLTIISNPTEAEVEIDGKMYNKTPLTIDITSGEHTILISRANYLRRSIRADLPANFNLIVSTDLALSEADLTSVTAPVITQTPEVVVKDTVAPNPGFLRVRDKPSISGKELARANPGDRLVLLAEQGAWYRVRLSDGTEGFVSASYVEKKSP